MGQRSPVPDQGQGLRMIQSVLNPFGTLPSQPAPSPPHICGLLHSDVLASIHIAPPKEHKLTKAVHGGARFKVFRAQAVSVGYVPKGLERVQSMPPAVVLRSTWRGEVCKVARNHFSRNKLQRRGGRSYRTTALVHASTGIGSRLGRRFRSSISSAVKRGSTIVDRLTLGNNSTFCPAY
jgi:hypothetical protein